MIKISVLVAIKNSAFFLEGCLDSLARQTSLADTEIIVIDGSDALKNSDYRIVTDYQKHLPSLKYLRIEADGLYAAWNLGIKNSKGTYLANLNADDRLSPTALEEMSCALDQHPDIALVYGDSYITEKPNETFENNSSGEAKTLWPVYTHKTLLLGCICGPHPMWRASVHKDCGFFDESFRIAGDYEFWLRVAEKYPMMHLDIVSGLYYKNPEGLCAMSRNRHIDEIRCIKRRFLNPDL